MKNITTILSIFTVIGMILAGIALIIYYIIELISSFFSSTINMIDVTGVLWPIICVCFGSSMLALCLLYIIEKKSR